MAIDIILQGKGGVGKSFAATCLAQYKINKGKHIACIDTDPVNNTFSGFKSLQVTYIPVLENAGINQKKFDVMMETVAENIEDTDFVIDNGASTFIPLSAYLAESGAYDMLVEMGGEVNIHTVITGGQAMSDTLNGLKTLCETTPENVNIIVWLNPYFGKIEKDGKTFEQMKIYSTYKNRIHGIVNLPERNRNTFGDDVKSMLESKMTFDEALNDGSFGIMTKQRLKMVRNDTFQALDAAFGSVE